MLPCSNRHPSIINLRPDKTLFPLGKLVATPGAIELLQRLELNPFDFIERHWQGQWGDIDANDVKTNESAFRHGNRLLSSYRIDANTKLWVITEADRSVTTLLLPEEY